MPISSAEVGSSPATAGQPGCGVRGRRAVDGGIWGRWRFGLRWIPWLEFPAGLLRDTAPDYQQADATINGVESREFRP
jgi:hypothetical protein